MGMLHLLSVCPAERMITNETYKMIISGIDKQKNYYFCYLNKQKQEYYEEALSHRNTEF